MNRLNTTLYGVDSPNVVKVVIMLEEIAKPYDLRFVSVFKGEQFTPEFQALNPLGKVPVLVDPELDRPLAESGAILLWLSEQSGRFLPRESGPRAEAYQWLMFQMANVGPMFGQCSHFRMLPRGSQPYAAGRYQAQAEALYRILDDRLAANEWLAGGAYTIADMATKPWTDYLERHGLELRDYPALAAWRQRISSRAAVMRAKQRVLEAFDEHSRRSREAASAADLDRLFGRTAAMPELDYSSIMGKT
jgi:GSH-dependent disulfide-bond oxidoreductase